MKYVVKITEKLVKHVIVEAECTSEAEEKAFAAHYNGKVTLDYSDYDGVDCEWIRRANESDIADYIDVEEL